MQAHRYLRLVVLIAAGFCSACSVERHELGRQSSPDQKLVAILIQSSAGDADAVSYDLFIDEVRASRNLDKPIFSASGCAGMSFSWLNDYTLQVRYPSPCHVHHFTNRWYRPSDVAVGRVTPFEVVLIRDQ